MKQRKILHIITRLDNGGSAVSTFLCASGPDAAAFKTAVAVGGKQALQAADALARRFSSAGAEIFCVPHLRREPSLLWDPVAFVELLAILFRHKPDIVHTHTSKAGAIGRCATAVYKLFSRNGIKVVHTAHGHVFYGYFSPAKTSFYICIERFCAKLSDRLVALSESEKRESIARGIGRPEQWAVIHSGVDLPETAVPDETRQKLRAALGLPPDCVLAGFAGRLTAIKGLDTFLRAAALMKNNEKLRFLLVGEGEERPRLEKLAAELDLGGKVIFSGFRENIFEYLSAMDIFVHPSLNEGMGRALVEAQAAGLPVAATTVCGIPDVVHDGKAGILVPPSDENALALAIERLCANAQLRKTYGDYGKAWVHGPDENGLPRFSTRAMAHKLEALYKSL